MSSRDKILQAVKRNQPPDLPYSASQVQHTLPENAIEKFKTVLVAIGGAVLEIEQLAEIKDYIAKAFPSAKQIANALEGLTVDTGMFTLDDKPHVLKDIDIAIMKGHFGVAENGSIWITEDLMLDRALPFICEHLILVLEKNKILPTMHEAYGKIGNSYYDYGTFIAGPSKTADIEQSLVLGAHGPKSLMVFLVDGVP